MTDASTPILRVEGLTKSFGGIRALDGCTLEVQRGTITGLIGPNGAGKSTLFNTIMGLYAPDAGRIFFSADRASSTPVGRLADIVCRRLGGSRQTRRFWDALRRAGDRARTAGLPMPRAQALFVPGDRVDQLPAWELVERGLVKTFQIPRELRNLTVLENLLLWARDSPGERLGNVVLHPIRTRRAQRAVQRRAEDILRFVGLFDLRDEYAKNLSGGQKKILELARALMADPAMILLDEPVAGVNPTLTVKILDLIARLKAEGKTFFLIEHDMEVVMSRCDWIIVMHQGKKLAEGWPHEVKQDQRVVEAYLGD